MNPNQNDQVLWASIQKDNQKAFEIVYKMYVKPLYALVSKRIDEPALVEDLVQDIFLTLWEKRAVYKPQGALYPYLHGMAINRVLNHFRVNKLKYQHVEIWEDLPKGVVSLQELTLAFRQAQTDEMEGLLEKAVAGLPQRLKQVYQLRFEEDRTVHEISAALSSTPSTVYSQLDTIRKKFLLVLKHTSYYTFL